MSDQLLVVLRVCLLVFMYIVFLRILRVVWVELRGSASVRLGTAPVPLVARASVAVPAPVAGPSTGRRQNRGYLGKPSSFRAKRSRRLG